ncbi:MAG: hypothetical protein WBC19_12780 [Pyrinomonadaceae bacterium]|nr:hypothetical protein [Chloracidobacterium sp.]MBP7416214.1 hypothetical protein [Pyrinomonadaceae bacterium]
MKKLFIITAITLLTAMATLAKDPETFSVQIGEQKVTTTGKITVKFIEVLEDSRCPPHVTCIWAGNAKIKISVKKGRKAAKTFELNSGLDPKTIVFEGYDITFVDLRMIPGEEVKVRAFPKTVTLAISKHKK